MSWRNTREITFTRGRPNHSNDQAHIEQKNWDQSPPQRRLLPLRHQPGTDLLNQLWLAVELSNLFTPQQKLKNQDPHRSESHQDLRHRHHPADCSVTTPLVGGSQPRGLGQHLTTRQVLISRRGGRGPGYGEPK
ncbi:MAG: hypothetical protein R2703_14895 [Micropruina glycogenica]